jgi:diguanylate cyclase (GGDEF)-like protein
MISVTATGYNVIDIDSAKKHNPDIILLDGMMPEMDGFDACKVLKSSEKTKDIPIVFLTANYTDVQDRVKGFEMGADDYLLKPFNSRELVARVKSILKRTDMLRLIKRENEDLTYKNKSIRKELEDFLERTKRIDKNSIIDPLTGLYNFDFFKRRLREEFLRASRYESPLSLVIIGVNNFEKLNETLGYQLGNYVIIRMANYILNKTREVDILCHHQDDGFCILLPQTSEQGGFNKAERIRVALSNAEYIDDEVVDTIKFARRRITEHRNITVNLGVASYPHEGITCKDENELFKMAQEALSNSKTNGENLTMSYAQSMVP